MATKTKPREVVVIWSMDGGETVSYIAFNGGNGPVRVYSEDDVDPRALREGIPTFDSAPRLAAYFEHKRVLGETDALKLSCLVTVDVAKKLTPHITFERVSP